LRRLPGFNAEKVAAIDAEGGRRACVSAVMPRAGCLFLALTIDSSVPLTDRQTTQLKTHVKTRLRAMLATNRAETHDERDGGNSWALRILSVFIRIMPYCSARLGSYCTPTSICQKRPPTRRQPGRATAIPETAAIVEAGLWRQRGGTDPGCGAGTCGGRYRKAWPSRLSKLDSQNCNGRAACKSATQSPAISARLKPALLVERAVELRTRCP